MSDFNRAAFEKYTQQMSTATDESSIVISQSIINTLNSYTTTMEPNPAKTGKVLQNGHWVWIRELSPEERAEHWKSYADDELHDTVDSILDELRAREKQRQKK